MKDKSEENIKKYYNELLFMDIKLFNFTGFNRAYGSTME